MPGSGGKHDGRNYGADDLHHLPFIGEPFSHADSIALFLRKYARYPKVSGASPCAQLALQRRRLSSHLAHERRVVQIFQIDLDVGQRAG